MSVIVPIYGVECYLERCVDSVLAQSYRDIEVILVDDGSPDRCGELCDAYVWQDTRVRVIHQANAGVSAARNAGIDAAEGDLLMFVDGDDWIEPDILAHLVGALDESGADIAACGFRLSTSEGHQKAQPTITTRVLTTREALNLYAGPLASAMVAPWGKVYRRSLFDGIRFPVGRLYEDEYVTYRVVSRARTVALSSARLYNYFVRAGSTTQRVQDASQVVDRAQAMQERGDYFQSIGLDEAAAVSFWKALLLFRLASRLERAAGNRGAARAITRGSRSLVKDIVRADLPLSRRAFAGAYAVAPRSVDRAGTLIRRAGSAAIRILRRARRSSPERPNSVIRLDLPAPHPDDSEPRQLEIIVVAYGSPDMLRQALQPVVSLPVTVVDNSSMTEIAELCRELGVRYIDAGCNGGFAAGVNIGLANRQWSDSDVLLLNPDAIITRGEVQRLHQALLAEPDLGSVGPAQVDSHGRPSRVTWPFPSPWGTWAEGLGLHVLRRRAPTYVIGSVLLLRAEAIDEAGLFDERFFLYSEEADWAYRAHRRGWRHMVVPHVQAIHFGGATSSDEARRTSHFHGSQERYFRKHYGAVGWQTARWGQILGDSLRATFRHGPARHRLRDRVALYRRGPVVVEAEHVARSAPSAARVSANGRGDQQ